MFERTLHHPMHGAPTVIHPIGHSDLLHSTHCDSGTLCSSHQSATSFARLPNSDENFGIDQSVAFPQTASAKIPATTIAVGTVCRSHCTMLVCSGFFASAAGSDVGFDTGDVIAAI